MGMKIELVLKIIDCTASLILILLPPLYKVLRIKVVKTLLKN